MASARCSRLRLFRSKNIIIVLLLSFSGLLLYNFLLRSSVSLFTNSGGSFIHSRGVLIVSTVLYPLLGWLADTYWTRYRVIKVSLYIMWFSSLVFSLIPFIPAHSATLGPLRQVLSTVVFFVMSLSLGGFQANILQFGVDQLVDASSAEIGAFSCWYVWVWHLSVMVVHFSQNCLCLLYEHFAVLVLPVSLTMAVSIDCIFNHCLIKEPVSRYNPLKLIYKVMGFALRNKSPLQRSAFTYSDDERYSRMDLAMMKYGGPFTTEEVESVKTFWRMTTIISFCSLFVGLLTVFTTIAAKMSYHLSDRNSKQHYTDECTVHSMGHCLRGQIVSTSGYILSIVFIPLHEFVLYRAFRRVSILSKFNIGLFLCLLHMAGCLGLEIGAHLKLGLDNMSSTNVTCLLENKEHTGNFLPVDLEWKSIPNSVYGLGVFFMISSTVEFVCAQTPYNMKGLIVGFVYGSSGASEFLGYLLLLPLQSTVHKWGATGCGMWIFLSIFLLAVIIFVMICALSWCYKRRKREDVQCNEHIFAINYYDRYTLYNAVHS